MNIFTAVRISYLMRACRLLNISADAETLPNMPLFHATISFLTVESR
jgi:hypothetical protein